MKKIFIVVLMLILICSLVSCGESLGGLGAVAEAVDSKYVDFEIIASDATEGWTVCYDKNTKVMYVILDAYQSTGMTPILNEDGTPKLYEGD
jgi:hypothetical protein